MDARASRYHEVYRRSLQDPVDRARGLAPETSGSCSERR